MSTTQCLTTVSLPAGENLNGDLYEVLTLNASGQVVKADTATEVVVGVLMIDPGRANAAGDHVTVGLIAGGGVGLVKASAAITAGALLIPTTTDGKVAGAADTAALVDGQMAFGIAIEAASAADEVIQFLAQPIAAGHGAT